jgi:hypothetical protein
MIKSAQIRSQETVTKNHLAFRVFAKELFHLFSNNSRALLVLLNTLLHR